MLPLDSEKWSELQDAYGSASKIPDLLKQLSSNTKPQPDFRAEPWFSLWSSLCHQGDIYPASFAAVPYIGDIAQHSEFPIDGSFFALPASIEIIRNQKSVSVPEELSSKYFEAIKNLATLASRYLDKMDASLFIRAAKAMVLVGEGKFTEADHVLDPIED